MVCRCSHVIQRNHSSCTELGNKGTFGGGDGHVLTAVTGSGYQAWSKLKAQTINGDTHAKLLRNYLSRDFFFLHIFKHMY